MSSQKDIQGFYELMQHVMMRTGMYAGNESFSHATAYLQGYAHAMEVSKKYNILDHFREYLVNHFGFGANLAWPAIIRHFYPDDKTAKLEAIKLFELFMSKSKEE